MKRRRSKIPGSYKPPEKRPNCEACLDRLERARKPMLDIPGSAAAAAAVLTAVPPYGPKVRIRVRGIKIWACPRCDSFRSDDNGPVPLIVDLENRRDRSRAGKTIFR